jgi:hypothetical protein
MSAFKQLFGARSGEQQGGRPSKRQKTQEEVSEEQKLVRFVFVVCRVV